VLARDPRWAPKPFQPLYFYEFGNNARPRLASPANDLYVSVLPMPFSTSAQRRTVRHELISAYNPVWPGGDDVSRRMDELEARQSEQHAQVLTLLTHLAKLFEPQPVGPRRPIGFQPEPAY